MSTLDKALSAIDALHAEDPTVVTVDDVERPKELVYAERMSAALARLVPAPSDALRLAVRAQHLQRWTLPRTDFPEGRAGYHRWREDAKAHHAELASNTLRAAGCDDATVARVAKLVLKKDRTKDPEAQTVEDAACLVFLEHELPAFAAEREDDAIVPILKKTWAKMSEPAQRLAKALPFGPRESLLLLAALED